MRNNIVLIDFENVQPESLDQLAEEHYGVVVFIGAKQTKLRTKFVASLHQLGSRAECIQISGNGRNALDFHIAYFIGVLSVTDPSAYFHIVSKDPGYDPLIQYLRTRKILVRRVEDLSHFLSIQPATLVKTTRPTQPACANSTDERVQVVIDRLALPKATKPRTVKRLANLITSIFQKQLPDKEIASVVKGLKKRGIISVDGVSRVTYA